MGTARRDVSREQRRTATRSLTLRHTPPSERLGQVVFCAVTWSESRNASRPHAICDFGPISWRRETQAQKNVLTKGKTSVTRHETCNQVLGRQETMGKTKK